MKLFHFKDLYIHGNDKVSIFNRLLSIKTMLLLCLSCFFIAPLYAQEIKILTWENYLSEQVVKEFTKKTGHTVKLHYYDSGPERNAMLSNGQGSQFDLVLAENEITEHYGKLGVLQPLAPIQIGNV